MHGLVNKSLQGFLRDTYGPEFWAEVGAEIGAPADGFEAMLRYPDAMTDALVEAAARRLDRPREVMLEDYGLYLASLEPVRRLLRFGGPDFWSFLLSLADLDRRVALALPELCVPRLSARAEGQVVRLSAHGGRDGFVTVMAGLVRGMADDYGALALIEAEGGHTLAVQLLDPAHAAGRAFALAAGARV